MTSRERKLIGYMAAEPSPQVTTALPMDIDSVAEIYYAMKNCGGESYEGFPRHDELITDEGLEILNRIAKEMLA